MLITKEQLVNACTLTINGVREAMQRGGYTIARGELTGVEFSGITVNGTIVYEVFGPNPDDDTEDDVSIGKVYLKFERGPLSKEFHLVGDY